MRGFMNEPEPICYGCKHALKRGEFRECSIGGTGYKHTGMIVDCEMWEDADEKEKADKASRKVGGKTGM